MKIHTRKSGLEVTLFLEAEDEIEGKILKDFCRLDEPVVAVIRHDPHYRHRHIEVRKESQ